MVVPTVDHKDLLVHHLLVEVVNYKVLVDSVALVAVAPIRPSVVGPETS